MALGKPGRRTIIDTSDDSYGPFGVASHAQLAMAAGWQPGPLPSPPWPDPPPVTVNLQERVFIDPSNWPATSSQVLSDCLDIGGMYSGGLSQVIFYQDVAAASTEEYKLTLQTAPVLEESAFTDVLDLAIVNVSNNVASGDVLSVWFGNFDESASLPVARFLRWKLTITDPNSARRLIFSVRLFLKNKK